MFQLPTGVSPEHMYGAHFASRHATYAPVIDAVLYRLTVDRSPPLHRAVELYCRPPLGSLTLHDVGSWPMTIHPVVGMGVEGAEALVPTTTPSNMTRAVVPGAVQDTDSRCLERGGVCG